MSLLWGGQTVNESAACSCSSAGLDCLLCLSIEFVREFPSEKQCARAASASQHNVVTSQGASASNMTWCVNYPCQQVKILQQNTSNTPATELSGWRWPETEQTFWLITSYLSIWWAQSGQTMANNILLLHWRIIELSRVESSQAEFVKWIGWFVSWWWENNWGFYRAEFI